MNDMEFLTAFEHGTLHHFPYRAHLRMAWIYLRKEGWKRGINPYPRWVGSSLIVLI